MAQDKAAAPARSHKPRDAEKLMFELGAHESIGGVTALAESLLGRLRALDFHCYEAMPAAEAVPHLLRGPVSDALKAANEAMRLVRSLPRLVGAEPVAWDADDSRSEADAHAGLGVSEGRPAPYTPGITAAVNVALEAALQSAKGPAQSGAVATRAQLEEFAVLCGRTVAHLKEAVEGLRAARRERAKWGLITAGEEVRRITRKSLRACCLTAMRLLNVGDAHKHFAKDVSDLQAGLWTRAALMAFAHDMQELAQVGAGIDGVDLGMHMRDIRIRMLQLSGDAHYSELRAPDRYQLQLLCSEISYWLDHSWEDFSRARALLTQATALASQLSQINRRDLLVAHDKEVQALAQSKLQALLAGPVDDRDGERLWRGLADVLEVLMRICWRDQALDAVVQTQLHGLKPAAGDRTAANTAGVQGRGGVVDKARRDAAALHGQAKQLQATLAAVTIG